MTRQRQYQLRNRALGRCMKCSSDVIKRSKTYCEFHRLQDLENRKLRNSNFSREFWSKLLKQFL